METAIIISYVIGWGFVGVFTYWGITDADDKATNKTTQRHHVRRLHRLRTDNQFCAFACSNHRARALPQGDSTHST